MVKRWSRARAICAVAMRGVAGIKAGDVRKYGAKGDGTTKDTAAIQKAIDDCTTTGGMVVLKGGQFVTGPIEVKSNIILDVEKDATLLGSVDREDYPKATRMRQPTVQPLIAVTN